ncbi:MAG: HupE/UreJ family protein [Verrucomicrobiota bacterium]
MFRVFNAGWCAALLWLVLAVGVQAHQPGLSYLNLKVETDGIAGVLDASLRDLEFTVKLDQDDNGSVTYEELLSRQPAIAGYVLKHLKISGDGQVGQIHVTEHVVASDADGVYARVLFEVSGMAVPQVLEVDYRLFTEFDPQHRGLLQLDYAGAPRYAVFRANDPTQRFDLAQPERGRAVLDFLLEGVWHIWIGFDHILFLLALLFPAVLSFREGRWVAVEQFRPAFINVFKVVTAFTVAHSITLTLATLELVTLPSRFVESAIAASVILAASNNLHPYFKERVWLVAFGFGLIHGFGFASVLTERGFPAQGVTLALVSFNVGVELGQLAIVSVFLPLAFGLRASWLYQRLICQAGSCAIILIATVWMVERVFALELLKLK